MELSSFSENVVTETFERSGDALVLKINIDAIVPEYHEVLNERLKPTIERLSSLITVHKELSDEISKIIAENKEGKKKTKPKKIDVDGLMLRASTIRKEVDELNREVFAERLTCPVVLPDGSITCLLKGWDMTENGMLIDASKTNLLRLPPKAVEALHEFVIGKLETIKKKGDEEDEETSENTHSGSKGLHVLAPTG